MTITPDIMERARELAYAIEAKMYVVDSDCREAPEACIDHTILRNLIAAALAEARAVPQGYVLVPIEPTEEMADLAAKNNEEECRHRCSACLRDFSSHGSCIVHIGNYHSKGGIGEFVPQAYPIRKE